MVLTQKQDGSIVVIDPLTGEELALTQEEVMHQNGRFSDYTEEWRLKIYTKGSQYGLSKYSCDLIISGYFDHNKERLASHLRRAKKPQLINKIWELIK